MDLPSKQQLNVEDTPTKPTVPKLHGDEADECSDFLSNAKIDEVKRIPMSVFERRNEARGIDLRDVTAEDLESLRGTDPFLYYSIPGVRAARLALRDVDPTDIDALAGGPVGQAPLAPPQQPEDQPPVPINTKIVRRKRISFERDPIDVMDEMLGGMFNFN